MALGDRDAAILRGVVAASLPIDLKDLNRLLAEGNRWSHGPVTACRAKRIGVGFGLSGFVHRLMVETAQGAHSLVAKVETVELVERALAFRRANETSLARSIPALLGSSIDGPSGAGVLLLEDVTPAAQGDELHGCSPERARAVIQVIARLHAGTWNATGVPSGWGRRPWEPGRWDDRLTLAAARYPDDFTPPRLARLKRFDGEADDAVANLARGPSTWIHGDPHLDNVLWRPNGDAVVLDWATSSIGPPAFDLAVLVTSLAMGPSPSLTPAEAIESYIANVTRDGTVALSRADATQMVRLAIRHLIQGMVGFAGFPTEPPVRRARLLRDHAAVTTTAALAWIDNHDQT